MDVDEVSELFRRGFQTMYKSSLLGQSVQDRKTILTDFRREKRSTLAFQNRNIDVNMSPINTPKVGRHVDHRDKRINTQEPVKNKRLEMLAEWKKQKAQQKVIEKTKNAKPVFKVTHVKATVKSDIDTANQFIKGKPIPFNVTHSWGIQPDHQFKFKAPNLIKAPSFNQHILHPNKAKNEKTKLLIEKPKITKASSERQFSVTKATNKEIKPLRPTKAPDLNNTATSKVAEKVQSKYSLRNRNFQGMTNKVNNKIETKSNIDIPKKIDNKRQIVKSDSKKKSETQKLPNMKVTHKSLEKIPSKELIVNILSERSTTSKKTHKSLETPSKELIVNIVSERTTTSKKTHKSLEKTPSKELIVNIVSEKSNTSKKTHKSLEKTPSKELIVNIVPERSNTSKKIHMSLEKTPSKQLVVNVRSERFTTPKKFVSSEDIDDDEVFIKPESAKKSAKKYTSKPETTPSKVLTLSSKKTPVSSKTNRKSSTRFGFECSAIEVDTSNRDVGMSENNKLDSELCIKEKSITPSKTKSKDQMVFKTSGKKTPINSMGDRRQSARRSVKVTPKELNITDDVIATDKTGKELLKTIESKENITPTNTNQVNYIAEKTPVIKSSKSRRSLKQGSINHTPKVLISDDELVTHTKPMSAIESDKLTDATEKVESKPLRSSNEKTTPNKPIDTGEDVFYISPHVTFARGKDAARKEFKMRLSTGGSLPDTPEFSRSVIEATTPRAGAAFFSHKLDEEAARIERMCLEWEDYREDPALPAEAHDSIDVAIGQSKLLVAKKFGQFRGLIGKCRTQTNDDENDRPVTCQDLHGFWDMMYMQIEDVDKRFQNLCRLRDNSWHELLPQKNVPAEKKRGRGRPKKAASAASSKLREAIKAARKKKKQTVTEVEEIKEAQEEKVFEGGYFEVRSPISNVVQQVNKSDRSKPNLRRSTIMLEAKKRCSLSPGLAIMSVSSSIKLGNGLTPSKSILKSTGSTIKNTKSVIFSDEVNKSIVKVRLFAAEDE